ncbi:MAG TPA: allantoicase [Gemmatimonadota bacterium]
MSEPAIWPDLASERLGGRAILANDEFFAPKENLLREAAPVFDPSRYTDRGKWMDGWETRRRRAPGNDWCIVRLGVRGIVREIVVDTSHFRGNHPESAAVDAASLEVEPARWEDGDVEWSELVPRSSLAGDSAHRFPVSDEGSWTHVRLSIFPDGGVARLRVHGEVVADWSRIAQETGRRGVEVAAATRGGIVMACSDAFFGNPDHLLLPDAPRGMWDGWETRRRRGPGHDWVVVRLGRRCRIERLEIDTRHFKGNHPESARVEAIDAAGASADELTAEGAAWTELVPRTRLRPDVAHVLEPPDPSTAEATHVRLSIFPDGGVARLRVWGEPLA